MSGNVFALRAREREKIEPYIVQVLQKESDVMKE